MELKKVTNDELISQIDSKVRNSIGGLTGAGDLSSRRENATYEFNMTPLGDLKPQGVSKIVSSDTTEVIESYTALTTKLLLDNNKLANFVPRSARPRDIHQAKVASDLVNYCIFNKNDGWKTINTWVKSAYLYGNGTLSWSWAESFEYEMEEYDQINETVLDELLSDPLVEIVGDLEVIENYEEGPQEQLYQNVRLRRKVDNSKVVLEAIPPEAFLINKDAKSIQDATFVAKVVELSYSEIRQMFPSFKKDLSEIGENAEVGRGMSWSQEISSRKESVGIDNWLLNEAADESDEANTVLEVIECWIRTDRDGDGIAELKHVIKAGDDILQEDDVSYIPVADLNPVEIPHEYHGLSLADMVRPQMQATTAILRGFVENVYFGNYGRTLADPNVVDFSALQNPVPKQVIATNGPAVNSVQQLGPDPISPGTQGMLEYLQLQKEQSTGLSKAAMGLNDALYVSGNSEAKIAGAQNSAQIRIEHIARRFMETGFKDLCRGLLKEMKQNIKEDMMYKTDKGYASISPSDLQMIPSNLDLDIQANLGENSNSNMQMKLQQMGELIPLMAQDPTARKYISKDAAFNLGVKMVNSMGLDPLDYFVDPDDPQVMEQIEASEQERQQQESAASKSQQAAQDANTSLIKAEIDNKKIDNKRQLLEAEDDSNRSWAEIKIKAEGTEGAQPPVKIPVDFQGLYQDTEEQEKQAAEQEQMQQQQMQQQQQQMQGGMQNG
jgi:hypothetical protein|tara:strand:+ start:2184 stop:4358 length:2175 start_codon:yes stop_codon:yes gene_type:complete